MTQLVEELDELPSDTVSRHLRSAVDGNNESARLLVIAYLASRVQAEKPFAGGASLIDQLAGQDQSELVTAVGMFVQLTISKIKVSQQHVDQLKRNSPLVAPAVLGAMLLTDQFTAIEEMGRAAATSVLHSTSDYAYATDSLLKPVFDKQTSGSESSQQEAEATFLRDFGKHLVRGWQETKAFSGLFSIFKLGALNLLDDDTRQLADRQLMARIKHLVDLRTNLKTVAELISSLSNSDQGPSLLDLTNTLLHVRGEFPTQLRDRPIDPASTLGIEFSQWESALAKNERSEDRHVWMIWYPLETTEAYLRQMGSDPAQTETRYWPFFDSRRPVPAYHEVLPEIAITVASSKTAEADLQ